MSYVALEGSCVYYEDEGAGKQALITIHWTTRDTLSWRHNTQHFIKRSLPRSRRAVAPCQVVGRAVPALA